MVPPLEEGDLISEASQINGTFQERRRSACGADWKALAG